MREDLEDIFLKALDDNQQKLLRVCSIYGKDADDTKDLFQEVLINIWKSMPSFKGNSSIETWMYRIALNVCLRFRSNLKKKQERFMRLESIRIVEAKPEVKENEQSEQLQQLRNCIKVLNEADKAVITLYLEQLPYKEISKVLGLSENNIAVKVKRIKKKLSNCINKAS